MMLSVFILLLLAMVTLLLKRHAWTMAALWFGLLLTGFLLWYHATDKIGINF